MRIQRLKFDIKRAAQKIVMWIFGKGKIAQTIILGIAGLLAIVIVLGFVPFSSQTLKTKVESIIKESFAESCSIEKLTVTLWAGVLVKKIQCEWHDPAGASFSCMVPEAGISYHVLPLIFKQIIIKNITLENPRITCKLPAETRVTKGQSAPFSVDKFTDALAGFPYRLLVQNITLSKARILVTQKRSVVVDGKGVGLSMKVGFDKAITLNGTCKADSLELLDSWHLAALKADIAMEGLSVKLSDCKAECYEGKITLKAAMDFSQNVLENAGITIGHIKLDKWYAREKIGPGKLSGKLDASMDFDRSALVVDSLIGHGAIKITGVEAHELPIQKNLIVAMAIPKLATMNFSIITSDLELTKGKIANQNTRGEGDPMDFTAIGSVDKNGQFSERITAQFSGEFVEMLPAFVQKSLLPVENDPAKRAFGCSVFGTFKNPRVLVDQRIVNRAVVNVMSEIGRGLNKLFGK